MNKMDLQRLEGLLLLSLLHKTKNKRLSASIVGISVDTMTKYISFLENDIGTKLHLNRKNSCTFTSKGNELITKLKNLDIEALFKILIFYVTVGCKRTFCFH